MLRYRFCPVVDDEDYELQATASVSSIIDIFGGDVQLKAYAISPTVMDDNDSWLRLYRGQCDVYSLSERTKEAQIVNCILCKSKVGTSNIAQRDMSLCQYCFLNGAQKQTD